jgi:P27 family predicted phage terminase small subunit
MGLRGPKKQDPCLNKLKGNPGKRKNSKSGNAAYVSLERLPAAPAHMTRIAKAEWRRCGRSLIEAGKLTKSNIKGFEAYCMAYARFRDAEKRIEAEGQTLVASRSGYTMPHPCVAISNQAQGKMERWMKMINSTDAKKPVEQSDPLGDFMARGKSIRRVK